MADPQCCFLRICLLTDMRQNNHFGFLAYDPCQQRSTVLIAQMSAVPGDPHLQIHRPAGTHQHLGIMVAFKNNVVCPFQHGQIFVFDVSGIGNIDELFLPACDHIADRPLRIVTQRDRGNRQMFDLKSLIRLKSP